MTYKDLLEQLQALDPERLEDNVSLYDSSIGEYLPAIRGVVTEETDVLDKGHFFIRF